MRKLAALAACAVLLGCNKTGGSTGGGAGSLLHTQDKGTQLTGPQMGQSITVKQDLLIKGFNDGQAGGKALLTDDEIRNTMMAFQQQMMQAQHTKDSACALTNE